jgi:hypothetical protein
MLAATVLVDPAFLQKTMSDPIIIGIKIYMPPVNYDIIIDQFAGGTVIVNKKMNGTKILIKVCTFAT